MKLRYSLFLAAAIAAAPAMAQDAPAQTSPAPAATAPAADAAAAPATVSDAEVTQFATAALAVNKIQSDTTVAEADRQPKLVAAITTAGLTAERFNAISQAMAADPALNKKIQAAAAAAQGSAPAAGATATPR